LQAGNADAWLRLEEVEAKLREALHLVSMLMQTRGRVVRPSPERKWHPGHYFALLAGDTTQAALLTRADEIADEPDVTGMMIRVKWDVLETTEGSYQWSLIDAVLERMEQNGKYLWVQLLDRVFGAVSDADLAPVPAYVKDIGGTGQGVMATKNGGMPALHRAPVMDREIAMLEAIAERYEDAEFFQGFLDTESAPGFGAVDPPVDFSNAALVTQLIREYAAVGLVARKSLFMAALNFPTDTALMTQAVQAVAATNSVGITGPDAFPGSFVTAADVYLGNVGGHDYRGEIAAGWQCQPAGVDDQSFETMWAAVHDDLQQQFVFWPRQTSTTGAGAGLHWLNIVLPNLRTGAYQVNAALPSTLA
jgi:hypothetical protein